MKQRNRLNTLNIPGLFQDAETGLSVFIKIYDVSDGGIGVYSADQLTPGQEIHWITLQGEIRLRVQWCREENADTANGRDFEDGFTFRAGMECLDSSRNLYEVMKASFDARSVKAE